MRPCADGGQSRRAVASELFVVCAIITVFGIQSYLQVIRTGEPAPRGSLYRTVGSVGCYVCEMAGAVALFARVSARLYVAAVSMVTGFVFMISGSWLLLVGVSREEAESGGSE